MNVAACVDVFVCFPCDRNHRGQFTVFVRELQAAAAAALCRRGALPAETGAVISGLGGDGGEG